MLSVPNVTVADRLLLESGSATSTWMCLERGRNAQVSARLITIVLLSAELLPSTKNLELRDLARSFL